MTDANKEKEKIHVLYVDDEEHNLVSFKASFRRSFKIWTAISADDARDILEKEEIHIIITDQRMPDETGVEFLVSILDKHPEPIRMLLTGYSDIEAVIDSINKGQVYRYITKPWNDKQLELSIRNAHEVYSLRKENKILFEKLKKANEQLEFLLRQKLLD
ncbi:response regulator [Salibacter sp.]|uniref:response regulator n=1 Tax=Salibacter sp. TaxID=2010995 RepID=UPI0028709E6E|nr:response regulator [Salibacter sp.]MDR9398405.1 response regulator [Salibacter sp.]MDR9487405.1 response regulator [Salibacter sp.]